MTHAGLPVLLVLLVPVTVAASPDEAADWHTQGLNLVAEGKFDQAVLAFDKACSMAPQNEDTCYYLARTLQTLDRWEEARAAFEKALRATTKQNAARVYRAAALNFLALGRASEAEKHFRIAITKAADADSLPEDPRVDFGVFLFREGRIDEATPLLKEAAQVSPKSARAHAELGRVLLDSGALDDAASQLEQAVSLEPRAWNVRLLYGRALLRLGRIEEGQNELNIARAGWTKAQGSSIVK